MMVSLISISESLKCFSKTLYFLSDIILNSIKQYKVESGIFPSRLFRLTSESPVKNSFLKIPIQNSFIQPLLHENRKLVV